MSTRFISKIPTAKAITEQYVALVINKIVDAVNWISPLHNNIIGQVQPGTEYRRTGMITYCTYSSTWQPTANGLFAKFSGEHTTSGGDNIETVSVSGVTSADYAMVWVKTQGAIAVVPVAWACGTDVITVTLSDDPGTDHVLRYLVFRVGTEGLWKYDSNGEWAFIG